MKLALFVLGIASAAATAPVTVIPPVGATSLSTVSSCGAAGDHASDVQVTLEPESPVPGQNFTITSSYTLDEVITSGKEATTATLNGIPVVDQTTDLCASLKTSPTPCPLQKGPQKSSTTSLLPTNVPSGVYAGKVAWTDQNGAPILCLQFSFTV